MTFDEGICFSGFGESKTSMRFTVIFGLMLASDPLGGICADDAVFAPNAKTLVELMRGHSMQPTGRLLRSDGLVDPGEQHRQAIVDQLRLLGTKSVPALIDALSDQDVQMRRNAALVLIALAASYEVKPQVDIREAIPALIKATDDVDTDVRAWAAHALAEIGPDAAPAIPALLILLKDTQEGPRNTSCMALGNMGSAAATALPMLHEALHDPSQDVRRFAQRAIDSISTKLVAAPNGSQPVRAKAN
jgi:hypothetical protein